MKYSSVDGGKRIRAFLVSQSSKMVNLSEENTMIISSSIESIHTYSLIHDDLPSNTWHGLELKEIKKERRCIQINYVSFKTDWPVEK